MGASTQPMTTENKSIMHIPKQHILLSFIVTGGIAGVHQRLDFYANQTYVYTNVKSNKHVSGNTPKCVNLAIREIMRNKSVLKDNYHSNYMVMDGFFYSMIIEETKAVTLGSLFGSKGTMPHWLYSDTQTIKNFFHNL